MAENVGVREGQVRTALGVPGMFLTAIWVAQTHGQAWWAFVALALAITVFLSGTLRYCPLYGLFGHRATR